MGAVTRDHPLRRMPAIRTIGALILREMSTSYGKSPGGFIWTVLEPVGGIALLTVIFSIAVRVPPMGSSFALFYATGLLPFMMFLDVSRRVAQSLQFSKQLLFYPGVTFVDAIFARFVLSLMIHALVFIFVVTGIIIYDDVELIMDIPRAVLAFSMSASLALGVGSMNCFLMRRFPVWSSVWAIVTKPLFLLSCIFVSYDSLPDGFRQVIWYNPLIHIVGTNRSAFYSTYRADYAQPIYVFTIAAVLFAIGLLLLTKWHRDLAQK